MSFNKVVGTYEYIGNDEPNTLGTDFPHGTIYSKVVDGGIQKYRFFNGSFVLVEESYTSSNRAKEYTIPVFDVTAVSAFTNQPEADDIQILSSSTEDVGKVTIWYLEHGTEDLKYATKDLDGTTAVDMIGDDLGDTLLAVFMGDHTGNPEHITPAIGTITIREKSGEQTITTIEAGKINVGMGIFEIGNKDILINNITGKIWYAVDKNWDGFVGRKYLTGYAASDENISEESGTLTIQSDTDGAETQIDVWK